MEDEAANVSWKSNPYICEHVQASSIWVDWDTLIVGGGSNCVPRVRLYTVFYPNVTHILCPYQNNCDEESFSDLKKYIDINYNQTVVNKILKTHQMVSCGWKHLEWGTT